MRQGPIDLQEHFRLAKQEAARDGMGVLAAPTKWRKARKGMSENHLALVRLMPCLVCGIRRSIHAHHLRCAQAGKERGISVKATDRWATSVCFFHHTDVHRVGSKREQEWFADNAGIEDICEYAQGIWRVTGNLDAMMRVLEAHKGR